MTPRVLAPLFCACVLLCPGASVPAEENAPRSAPVNRLARESSPYLRQHAANPVDWYPWGEEAFARARAENKPIFLSIGYSTCHWCHVMAREAFSDPEVAALLNAEFVCIKVDREERPDVDRVYLTFVTALNGEGGWPLNVWLTPDLKPFFGGTYFPVESHGARPGFKAIVSKLATVWKEQPESLKKRSEEMMTALREELQEKPAEGRPASAALRAQALADWSARFDAANGGFEKKPKFPQATVVDYLLDVQAESPVPEERERAREMASVTLRAMARGGIHDQLGGGFHRYSVDAEWHVPHFEKMLYDQALLAALYVKAWLVWREPLYEKTARDTLDYVVRELRDPAGGFHSAEDADSALPGDTAGAHAEGAYYVWTAGELAAALTAEEAAWAKTLWGVTEAGNAGGELPGKNVLREVVTSAEMRGQLGWSETELAAAEGRIREKLLRVRAGRPRPARDDKVITAWNALTISALARAAQVFDEPRYAAAAEEAGRFLKTSLFDGTTGQLARSWRAGQRDSRGFAEDYAFTVQAALDLYETTFDVDWLEWALRLQDAQEARFADASAGGYFASAADDASVVMRIKDVYDSAEPSANAVSVRNLGRLSAFLHRPGDLQRGEAALKAFGAQLERAPASAPTLLSALGWYEGSPQQVLVLGEAEAPATAAMLKTIRGHFLPQRVTLRIDAASRSFLGERIELVASLPEAAAGTSTAFVCRNFTCQLPTRELEVLRRQLEGKER